MLKDLQDKVAEHFDLASVADWTRREELAVSFVASNKVFATGSFASDDEALDTLTDALVMARDESENAKTVAAKTLARAEVAIIADALKLLMS